MGILLVLPSPVQSHTYFRTGLSTRKRGNLTEVPSDIPAEATKIWLYYNHIKMIRKNDFANQTVCTELDLAFNEISEVEEGAFRKMESLRNLTMNHNQLASVPTGIPASVVRLRLDSNKISEVRKEDFVNLAVCTELSLFWNKLSKTEDGAFRKMHKLETLQLSRNFLTLVPSDFPPSTRKIFARHNMIHKIKSENFLNLAECIELDLAYNQISQIEENAFRMMTKLEKLILFQNAITIIRKNDFIQQKLLCHLYLTYNQISEVESGAFKGMRKLSDLHLFENKLVSVPGDTPLWFSQIKFNKNQITRIRKEDFVNQIMCIFLDLSSNEISVIEDMAFENMAWLEHLKLEENKLTCLTPDTFTGLTTLHTLGLHDNPLSVIVADTFSSMSTPLTLSLSDPRLSTSVLKCNSDLCWLKQEELEGNIKWYKDPFQQYLVFKPRCAGWVNWKTWRCSPQGTVDVC